MRSLLTFAMFLMTLISCGSPADGEVLYNGEAVPYSVGQTWDQNGSIIKESTAAPHSPKKHIRANLRVKNWWGGAAYVFKAWQPVDLSKSASISFWLKSSSRTEAVVQLFDASNKSSAQNKISATTSYKKYTISLSAFKGVELSRITSIVFAVSVAGTKNFVLDIDDIGVSQSPVPVPTPTPTPTVNPVPSGTTMKTDGRFLYDACGQQMVLRGVNHMTCWTDWDGTPRDGLPMFSEIAKTGANVVRIVWIYTEGTTVAELDRAVTNAAASGLIPMIEIHNKTCEWSTAAVTEVLNWWISPDVVAMIKKHQKYLLVNFANEMGYGGLSSYSFIAEYTRAVTAMRLAGIRTPIVIDSSGCGQEEAQIMNSAPKLIANDPDHNLVFSLHIYWTDQNAARIQKAVGDSVALNIPMIIGEFAHKSVDCSTPILYKEIIKQAQLNQLGYLPWSWDKDNACAEHSMTKDNYYASLWGWGLEVMVTDPNSVKNTSVRSQCF